MLPRLPNHPPFYFLNRYGHHRDLHSFPTRRSSDLVPDEGDAREQRRRRQLLAGPRGVRVVQDRKSTRLNSSHSSISYAVFCLKKKNLTDYVLPPKPSSTPNLYNFLPRGRWPAGYTA